MSFNGALAMNDIQARLPSFSESSEFSDATIICGSVKVKVHKIILALQSDYFAKAFQVDAFREGKTGEIVLQAADTGNDDPEAVKLMIMYFYKQEHKDEMTLMMHAKLFALAIKYQIPGLRKIMADKLEYVLNDYDNSDNDLFRVAHYIYHSITDDVRELRDLVASELLARYERLRETPEGQMGLRSIPGVALDLLDLKTQRQKDTTILCHRGHHSGAGISSRFGCRFCGCHRPACSICKKQWKTQCCKFCGSEDAMETTKRKHSSSSEDSD